MKIEKVKEVLNAEIICGEDLMDMEVTMGCGCDLMSNVLQFIKHDQTLLLTGLTTAQAVFIADAVNIKAICFVRGNLPDDETIALANERNMVLSGVSLPMFEACGKLYEKGLIGCSEYEC